MPSDCITLVDVVRARSTAHPDRLAFTFLEEGLTRESRITYGELDTRARAVATLLRNLGAAQQRVLLVYPPGIDFIIGFLGCLYAGVVAVPTYPPDPTRLSKTLPRFLNIIADAGASIALTITDVLSLSEIIFQQAPRLQAMQWYSTDDVDPASAPAWRAPSLDPASVAFLQYTSGSTGDPKGVMVTHGNLLHNEAMIAKAFGHSERTVVVGWLPLYHDMGLVGNTLQPLFLGGSCYFMTPLEFLRNPIVWLQAMTKYRGTSGGGPNFAYDLCVLKTRPEQRAGLDLSSWQTAANGAEHPRAETIRRFSQTFAPFGFRPEAFTPCYGLAEATLFVSATAPGVEPVVRHLDGNEIERGVVVPIDEDRKVARAFVSSGRPQNAREIAIVDPRSGSRCPANQVGEIRVRGAHVACGYYGRPQETAETFGGTLDGDGGEGYLCTGDLGFLDEDGELFVTGRRKDLIIIRGRNIYPHDIERMAERSNRSLFRRGCSAAFSVDIDDEERLVIVMELERRHFQRDTHPVLNRRSPAPEVEAFSNDSDEAPNLEQAIQELRQHIHEQFDINVYSVALIKAGTIPKTSSGKIQRRACRESYLAGSLELIAFYKRERGPGDDVSLEPGSEIRKKILAAPKEARERIVMDYMRRILAQATDSDLAGLSNEASLVQLGVDSVMLLDIAEQLMDDLSITITTSGTMRQETLASFSRRVLSILQIAAEVERFDVEP